MAEPHRPHCIKPAACVAKGNGHCRSCHMRAKMADPEFRARQAAATQENWKDPEFRARNAAAVKEARGADASDVHITLAQPFKQRAAAIATEYGCSCDIAEDALILVEDDGLDLSQAIAAARRYAEEAHRHG